MKDWDYAKLSEMAKKNGGPEQLLQKVKDYNFQQGVKSERSKQTPKIMIATAGGAALCWLIQKIPTAVKYIKEKLPKKNISKEEAQVAEEILVEKLEGEENTTEENDSTSKTACDTP